MGSTARTAASERRPSVRAVVIPQVGSWELADVPEPGVRPGWLTIRVEAAGVCGTDLHILAGEFHMARYPCRPGHEFAGTVIEVGEDAGDFAVGDRVGIVPSVFCGTCRWCRTGRGNLCKTAGGFGTSMAGGFAERAAVLATHTFHLPDSITFPEAALCEPLSCVVHGFNRLRPRPGDTYLVYGAGTMGLMLAQYARFAGARAVALVDINDARLERARTFGFDTVGRSLDAVRDIAPDGFDNVIEATGVPAVVPGALDAVIRGGKVLLFGVYPPGETVPLEPAKIFVGELEVTSSMATFQSYGTAIEALTAGAIDAGRMVSHSFALDEFGAALDALRAGIGMKVQIQPNGIG
jgi:2-desacetyl-2-hydroxyethyl bacteriochlorophyllide A dehydrogenase